MIQPVLAPERVRGIRRWWLLSAVLMLIAAAFITLGLRGPQVAADGPPAEQSRFAGATAGGGDLAPPPGGAITQPAAPVGLRIPVIGVSVTLSALGLNPDRTVQVPTDFQQPGWFKLGPSPGQVGSAVILGHVDSYRGPAVFNKLRTLHTGDTVEVDLSGGATAHFTVASVATYLKTRFPAVQVYGSHGDSELQLVTCGGDFDTHTRSYLSNVVAYTTLTSITPSTGVPTATTAH